MNEPEAFSEAIRSLIANPGYVKALTQQIEARTADPRLVQQLIAYARSREVTRKERGGWPAVTLERLP